MPRLLEKLRGVAESTGGFADIDPGAYELVITKAEPHDHENYVRMYWDVRTGDRKGAYANSQYPPSDVLSWKDTAFGMYKHKLHMLAEANPNRLHAINGNDGKFASLKEAEDDNWTAFVGCRIFAVVRKRLYTAGPNAKNPGADRYNMEIAAYLTQQQYDDGDFSKALLEDRDQRDKSPVQQQQPVSVPESYEPVTDVYDEDVPF